VLGISTCWWRTPEDLGERILRDTRAMGLQGIELEYRIPESLYRRIRPRIKKNVKALSIHNFFPKPEDVPDRQGSGDLFLLSSADDNERLQAVKYTLRTMEHAQDLEVKAVILHLGRVDMPQLPVNAAKSNGAKVTADHKRARQEAKAKHWDAVLSSLDVLNREAEKRGIYLGIENRYHFHEIPDYEEIGMILSAFQGGRVRYWHDVGHARAQENRGVVAQKDLLKAYGHAMIGVHLHDARGMDDHFAPGQGEVDFEALAPFLKPVPIKIMEVHAKVAREDLLKGIRYLKALGLT